MSPAQLATAFFAALAATVVALAVAVVLAHKHRAKEHVLAVGVMLAFLVVTVLCTEALVRHYTFLPRARAVHMPFAYAAAGLVTLPVVTGALHWKGRVSRRVHQAAVGLWALSLVAALGTGLWMFSGAAPRAAATEASAELGPR